MELEGTITMTERQSNRPLTQKVLTEATPALEHVRDRLQRAVSHPELAQPTVVEQCVNSFLKHPLRCSP